MKGVRQMVFAIASTVLTLACQGCVSTSPHEYVRSEPAVPPTLGMTMALTGFATTGPRQADPAAASVHVVDGAPARFSGTVVAPLPVTAIDFASSTLPDYGITPRFVPTDLPELSWSGSGPLVAVVAERSKARLSGPSQIEKNIAAEIAFSAPKELTGLSFDVGVAPRIVVREEGELKSKRVGGEVRIGQDFNLIGRDGQPQGWYIFAGADGEALIWDAGNTSFAPNLNDMALTDQITVGDMQAGISVQRGGGELSLSYIRREVKYEDRNGSLSDTEDFAGVSFTMRR
jgi:hypothetical protein